MKETNTFTAIVKRQGETYVARCLELDVINQGETIEEAVSNLKEAVELYLEKEDIHLPIKRPFMTTFNVTTEQKRRTKKSN